MTTDLTEEEKEVLKEEFNMSDEEIDQAVNEISNEETDAPERKQSDSLLKFLRDVLKLKDEEYSEISRSGNLKQDELGYLHTPARSLLHYANFAETEGYSVVASYLRNTSNVWFNTSLSKDGFFIQLPTKHTNVSKSVAPRQEVRKKGLFGETVTTTGGEDS